MDWKLVALAVTVVVIAAVGLYLLLGAHGAISSSGGFKAWVTDLASTNYRIAVFLWMSVGVVVVVTAGLMMHAVAPLIVGEMQIEIVQATYVFLAAGLGIGALQFWAKRWTEDPDVIAAHNAANGGTEPPPNVPPPVIMPTPQPAPQPPPINVGDPQAQVSRLDAARPAIGRTER